MWIECGNAPQTSAPLSGVVCKIQHFMAREAIFLLDDSEQEWNKVQTKTVNEQARWPGWNLNLSTTLSTMFRRARALAEDAEEKLPCLPSSPPCFSLVPPYLPC